jgi:hypothetical protein
VGWCWPEIYIKSSKPDVRCEGTRKQDVLYGTDGPDRIFGLGNGDGLLGFGGNDEFYGGPDTDALDGGGGDQADDTLRGGKDADRYYFQGAWGDDTIIDTAIENVDPSVGGDTDNFYDYTGDFDYNGDLTIDLNSDSGPLPEATDGTNTVN